MYHNEFASDMERVFNIYKASGARRQFEDVDKEESRLLHLIRILYKHKYPKAFARVITGVIENYNTTPLIYVCYRNAQDNSPYILSANDRISVKNN